MSDDRERQCQIARRHVRSVVAARPRRTRLHSRPQSLRAEAEALTGSHASSTRRQGGCGNDGTRRRKTRPASADRT